MLDQLITAAAVAVPAVPTAAPPPAVTVPVSGTQSISPADVAAYIDPRDVASFLPPPPPTTELVAVSEGFFRLLENVTMVALFVVGLFLLARLLHAWMLHRSTSSTNPMSISAARAPIRPATIATRWCCWRSASRWPASA